MTHPKYPNCASCTPKHLCYQHQREEDAKIRAKMEELKTDEGRVGVVWEEPPTPKAARKEVFYGAALDLLKLNPKRWARIKTYPAASSANSAANSLKKAPIRPGKWEYRAVKFGDGSRLCARYMGEEE